MNIPKKPKTSIDHYRPAGWVPVFEEQDYPDVSAITDELLVEADYTLSDVEQSRIRTTSSGDPIGDYSGRPDLQAAMIAYEHAALRLGRLAAQQID